MTDYRRPSQTNKDRLTDKASRGYEGLLALLQARGQLVPNAMAKFSPGYNTAVDTTSQGFSNLAGLGNDLQNQYYDMYGGIDQMTGLQGRANDMFAQQQGASNQAYARGQALFNMPGRQVQYALQQAGAPQGLLDLLNQGQPLYEAANAGAISVADIITRLNAMGKTSEAQALQLMVQDMLQSGKVSAQSGYDTAVNAASRGMDAVGQGYDAARSKAADLIQMLRGQ